ncbi:MAG: autoinducer binding domain-containing protein [Granulosicoccus sp.]
MSDSTVSDQNCSTFVVEAPIASLDESVVTSSQDARRLLYFDLANLISGASTTDELKIFCQSTAEALGYDYYLFGGFYPMVESIVMSSTFPAEWHAEYEANGYIAIDPTVKHWWTSTKPIVWCKVEYSEGKTGDLERMVMEHAQVFGLRSGISIPVHGSGAEGCMLSLASNEENVDFDIHDEAGLKIIVHAMHDATKRIIATASIGNEPNIETLTPREIECLSWTAKGKTSWATSRILDVSENTVIFHLRNAIKKLEVNNRSHAVAKAVAHSKITPF